MTLIDRNDVRLSTAIQCGLKWSLCYSYENQIVHINKYARELHSSRSSLVLCRWWNISIPYIVFWYYRYACAYALISSRILILRNFIVIVWSNHQRSQTRKKIGRKQKNQIVQSYETSRFALNIRTKKAARDLVL